MYLSTSNSTSSTLRMGGACYCADYCYKVRSVCDQSYIIALFDRLWYMNFLPKYCDMPIIYSSFVSNFPTEIWKLGTLDN